MSLFGHHVAAGQLAWLRIVVGALLAPACVPESARQGRAPSEHAATAAPQALSGVQGRLRLYPRFDRSLILWPGQAFEEPELPRELDHTLTARIKDDLIYGLTRGHTTITIPRGVHLDQVYLERCGTDVEVIIESGASLKLIELRCGQRFRFRGPGILGSVIVEGDGPTPVTDFVFDGLVFDMDAVGADGCEAMLFDVDRVAFLNSVGRAKAGAYSNFFLQNGVRNLLVANSNFAVSPGGNNGEPRWVVRLEQAPDWRHEMKQILFVDSTMQTYVQAFRLSSGGSGRISDVMLYRSTLVNLSQPDNVFHSQDQPPVHTDHVYLRECTTVMDDGDGPWTVSNFGGTPQFAQLGGTDKLVYVVDHTYKARAASVVGPDALTAIMKAGEKVGWDLQYLGTASDPKRTDGARFEYDPRIAEHWRADGSGDWPEIRSPLIGTGTLIGKSPYALH